MQYAYVNAIVKSSLERTGHSLPRHSVLLLYKYHVRLMEHHQLDYTFHVQDLLVGYLERGNTMGKQLKPIVESNASVNTGVNPADYHL
ncbi:MAG: hypothetical protein VW879_03475 [Opitutae bacterium]